MNSLNVMTRLAWRNVLRNWRQSLATLLAISMGFVAISLFDGFIRGVENRIRDGYINRAMLGHIVVFKAGATVHMDDEPWRYALTREDQEFLESFLARDPDFELRVRHLSVFGMASNGRNNAVFVGFGQDVEEGKRNRGDRWAWNAVAGKPLYLATPSSVLLGQGLGTLLGCESAPEWSDPRSIMSKQGGFRAEERPFTCYRKMLSLSSTTEHGQINAVEADVAGLTNPGIRDLDLKVIALPLELAQRLADTDRITLMSIRLKDENRAPAFVSRLRSASSAAGLKLDILPWEEHPNAQGMQKMTRVILVFRNIFLSVLVAISVLSIANTMMKSVSERTREIGTLRSLGFLSGDLAFMFALEGLFLSAFACGVGWLVSGIGAFAVTLAGFTYRAGVLSTPIPLEILFAPGAWIATSLVLITLATLTSFLTARKASRMEVAEALRAI